MVGKNPDFFSTFGGKRLGSSLTIALLLVPAAVMAGAYQANQGAAGRPGMVFCRKCGQSIGRGSATCPGCGDTAKAPRADER